MYLLIIVSTFLCTSGNTVDAEDHFEQKEYAQAVKHLSIRLGRIGQEKRIFNEEICTLDTVRAGHRRK